MKVDGTIPPSFFQLFFLRTRKEIAPYLSLWCQGLTRSSSREARIRVPIFSPFFSVVYFGREPLPQKRNGKREQLGDLVKVSPSQSFALALYQPDK